MFYVPIPEPELNRSSRRIRTALLNIVDALAPMDINCYFDTPHVQSQGILAS